MEVNRVYLFVDIYKERKEKDYRMIILPSGRSKIGLIRTKDYGILSVMVQAYYDVKYLFTVHENVFNPPPKVKSGVISLLRNPKEGLAGNETLFKNIVKAGFNQRRKKLSNALKVLNIPEGLSGHNFLNLRAEELSVQDFISFTNEWKENLK